MTVSLVNAERRNEAHPLTFAIPSLEQRSSLAPGDEAKLIFVSREDRQERMWVKVTRAFGNGEYRGELDNSPVFDHGGISLGSFIRFKPVHVIDIMSNDKLTD